MKIRIARRSELFLPIALLIPTALEHASEVTALLASYALARLCTFGAAEAFGRAAAQEMSPKRVRGAWTGALLFSLALCFAAWRWGPAVWMWLLAGEPLPADWQALCLTGAALALSRLNEEHLRANGQGGSAALCALVRALLLAGGAFCGAVWMAGAAVLGFLVSLAVAIAVGGNPFDMPNAIALARMPIATLRALLYPIPALLLLAGFSARSMTWATGGYLLGLAMFQCAASPFRRSQGESGALRIGLLVPGALVCAAAPLMPAEALALPAFAAFAACMGMLLNAAPTWAGVMAALALAASCLANWLPLVNAAIVAPVCAALALAFLYADVREGLRRRRRAYTGRVLAG